MLRKILNFVKQFLVFFFFVNPVTAQIIPTSDTQVIWDEPTKTFTVDRGITAGTNRFYSFTEFNLNAAQVANFLSNLETLNIFVRVLDSPSFIDGKLQSSTNLWFLNSNGLIFGPNASIDVNGIFTASTAIWVGFPDKYWFTARLNTVNPIGDPTVLGFGFFPNSILNFADLTSDRGIALVAGGIINLGTITAPFTTLVGTSSLPRKYTIIQNGQLIFVTSTSLQGAPLNVTNSFSLGALMNYSGLDEASGIRVLPDGKVELVGYEQFGVFGKTDIFTTYLEAESYVNSFNGQTVILPKPPTPQPSPSPSPTPTPQPSPSTLFLSPELQLIDRYCIGWNEVTNECLLWIRK